VALEGHPRVVPVHPAPVVGDPHEREPALVGVHRDARGPRVERVLDQLLHHGGGALHHLAGGDLVDETGGQEADAGHPGGRSTKVRLGIARRASADV